jgi:hypothetical protein
MANLAERAFQTTSEFTLKFCFAPAKGFSKQAYFVGIWPAPEAGRAGADGAVALLLTGTLVPGICAAPVAADAAGAGAVTAAPSSTLLPLARGCALPKYAKAKVQAKNTAANTPVVRDKKLALPLAPNKLPEPPLPKAAPMSAPLPCCTSTRPIMTMAVSICTARTMVNITFI